MKISVLMSVYKKEKPEYLKEAMDSILHQTHPADEIVLIEDGPLTPQLEECIAEYQRSTPQLRTYQFPENVQLGRALAKGVELCRNEYIARMDTDDIAKEYRLELQSSYLEKHPEVAVLGGAIEEFNDAGTVSNVKSMPTGIQKVRQYGKYRNPVNHMTVMFRKSVIEQAGNYQHFPFLEDYELWNRVLATGYQFDNLPEILVRARTNEDFYGKRGGYQYWKRYLRLRKKQKDNRLLTMREYVTACVLTTIMVASPNRMRTFFYKKILRRNKTV